MFNFQDTLREGVIKSPEMTSQTMKGSPVHEDTHAQSFHPRSQSDSDCVSIPGTVVPHMCFPPAVVLCKVNRFIVPMPMTRTQLSVWNEKQPARQVYVERHGGRTVAPTLWVFWRRG